MANYIQKSYLPPFGNKSPMDTNIVEDIRYLVEQSNSGDGNQQVLGTSVWANGFTVVGCIGEDITLPDNSTLKYASPLSMCVGATLIIPVETTLTIV